MSFYLVTSGGIAIEDAVKADCPSGHELRNRKPDDSWLPKLKKKFRSGNRYWTEEGMEKYVSSGLKDWHELVITLPMEVQMMEEVPGKIIYKDKYQVITQ